MKKRIWITALEKDEKQAQKLAEALARYGLQPEGHFWIDDLKNVAWRGPADELLKKETAVWVIMATMEELGKASVAFGLSLLALRVFAGRGHAFPVVLVWTAGDGSTYQAPTLLQGADVFAASNPSLAVKLVAAANAVPQPIEKDYHLNVHAFPGLGVWLEAGPAKGQEWKGALLGVHGGDIDFQAVGPRDVLPERSGLQYPVKGMKISLGEDEFTAWGAQNRLTHDDSYFARITGMPDRILFGPYPGEDAAEMHVVRLY